MNSLTATVPRFLRQAVAASMAYLDASEATRQASGPMTLITPGSETRQQQLRRIKILGLCWSIAMGMLFVAVIFPVGMITNPYLLSDLSYRLYELRNAMCFPVLLLYGWTILRTCDHYYKAFLKLSRSDQTSISSTPADMILAIENNRLGGSQYGPKDIGYARFDYDLKQLTIDGMNCQYVIHAGDVTQMRLRSWFGEHSIELKCVIAGQHQQKLFLSARGVDEEGSLTSKHSSITELIRRLEQVFGQSVVGASAR